MTQFIIDILSYIPLQIGSLLRIEPFFQNYLDNLIFRNGSIYLAIFLLALIGLFLATRNTEKWNQWVNWPITVQYIVRGLFLYIACFTPLLWFIVPGYYVIKHIIILIAIPFAK